MAEYIEREAAIKLIASDKTEISPLLCALVPTYTAEQAFDGLNQSCDRHIKFINSIPSADVQPVKHGRWVQTGGKYSRHKTIDRRILTCSVCGNALSMEGVNAGRGDANYCPNCGARMEGSE